jgi:hypothetical protein
MKKNRISEGRRNTPTPNNMLKKRLARYHEIKISVVGRKSGKTISTRLVRAGKRLSTR